MGGDEIQFFDDEPATAESSHGPQRRGAPPAHNVGIARLAGLVLLGIAIVIGLVFWVNSCSGQSKQDEYSAYLDSMRPLASGSAKIGSRFANILASPSLTLGGLESQLQQWSQEEQDAYASAQRIQPPGPLQAAHQGALSALQLRALGLSGLATTLKQAGQAKSSTPVSDSLAAQAQLLTASDTVWSQLFQAPTKATLDSGGVTGVIPPSSQFVTSPEIVSPRAFSLVYQRLRSGGSAAGGLHGSALIGTQAVGGGKTVTLSPTTTKTVNVSSDLVIKVTVENSGNYPEVHIPVTLRVDVGGNKVFSEQSVVRAIGQHEQTVVSFSKLQLPPSTFGHSATITVVVGAVQGEKNLANNHASYPVLFSLSGA